MVNERAVDWVAIAPQVAVALLGQPVVKTDREWSWEDPSSLKFNPVLGIWHRFSTGDGGGVLDMVQHVRRCSRDNAFEWIKNAGYTLDALPVYEKKAEVSEDRFVLNLPLQEADWGFYGYGIGHPVSRWLAHRRLWNTDGQIDIPQIAWLPAHANWFKGHHQGAGAMVVPVASISDWVWRDRHSRPVRSKISGFQMIHIDADGMPALDRLEEDGGLSKRSYGKLKGRVFAMMKGHHRVIPEVLVCEGVADALALYTHKRKPVIAAMSAGNFKNLVPELSRFKRVIAYADNDDAGKRSVIHLCKMLDAANPKMEIAARIFDDAKDAAEHYARAG